MSRTGWWLIVALVGLGMFWFAAAYLSAALGAAVTEVMR